MNHFVPAPFDLYEFDDGNLAAPRTPARKRWFSHWDGMIGAPAEDVTLGWSAGDSMALVCTSGRRFDRTEARHRAGHLALGGDTLPIAGRPQGPLATHRAIDDVARSDALWTATGDAADPQDASETAAPAGFSIGYRRLGDVLVFIAAVNVDLAEFGVRKVRDWSAYDLDARTGFPLRALNG